MLKGFSFHLFARISNIISSYFLHYFLAKSLNIEDYGVIGLFFSITNFYYLFLNDGIRQSTSVSIASGNYKNSEVVKKSVNIQLIFGLILAVLNWFFASYMARAFGDPSLAIYFRCISFQIFFTSVMAVFSGVLNGSKQFFLEAIVSFLYPILRLSAIPLLSVVNKNPILGAIIGFIFAAVISALLAIIFALMSKKKRPADKAGLIGFKYSYAIKKATGFLSFSAGITLMLNVGVFILRAVSSSDEMAGLYTAVNNFSLIPYYIAIAVLSAVTPYIAESVSSANYIKINKILKTLFQFFLSFLAPIAIIIAISSKKLIYAFYGDAYSSISTALSLQVIAVLIISVFAVMATVLVDMGHTRFIATVTVAMVICDISMHIFLAQEHGVNGASFSTLCSAVIGTMLVYLKLKKVLDINVSLLSTIKEYRKNLLIIILFSVISALIFAYIPYIGLIKLLLVFTGLGVLYIISILLSKAVSIKDIISVGKSDFS